MTSTEIAESTEPAGASVTEKRVRDRTLLTVDVTPDLLALYDAAAEAAGFSNRAEWVRVNLKRAAKQVLGEDAAPAGQPTGQP